MSFWKSVNEDFSEIDTSGVGTDGNLNNLASFDLADIIGDEHSLTNTDYINNNYQENQEGKDIDQVTLSRKNIEASKSANEVLKSPSPKGIDDQNGREDQSNCLPQHKEENQQEFAVKRESYRMKRRYPCIVCKKKFADKSSMKEHVRSTHLRHVALCNVCGRRMFQDKLVKHEEDFHRQNS